MSDFFDNFDLDEDESAELGSGEDEVLDPYNQTLVSTRGIDDQALFQDIEQFRGTPLIRCIQATSSLRQLYGPSDPTIADFCETIQSELTEILLSIQRRPLEFVLEILSAGKAPDELEPIINDILEVIQARKGIDHLRS